MATINSVNNDGLDLRQFNRELVEYLRGLLLIKTGSDEAVDLTAEDIAELKELAARASLAQILKAVKLFGQLEFSFDNYSTLPLELAIVDCSLISEGEKKSAAKQAEPEFRQPQKVATPPPEAKPKPASASQPVAATNASPPEAKPEPASAPQPVAATNASPPEPGSETERLRRDWRSVIEQAPQDTKKTPALAILRSAGVRPMSIENETVVLAFKYPYHKEQIEKVENQRVAEKVLSSFLGHSCQVRCILEDNHLLREALKMGAQIIDVEEK